DDRRAFPRYDAVLLQRTDLPEAASQALARLEGAISAREMVAMNARALLERVPEAQVASDFLRERFGISQAAAAGSALRRIGKRTVEHLFLVAVSLAVLIRAGTYVATIQTINILANRDGILDRTRPTGMMAGEVLTVCIELERSTDTHNLRN